MASSAAVSGNQAGVKLLGGSLPSFSNVNPGKVTLDTYVRQPAPAPAAQGAAQVKPQSELGKVAGDLYAGALGVGAGAGAVFMGKGMMSLIDQCGRLTFKNLAKQSLGVGGALMGLPFSLVQDSFGYKSGTISAKRYWGNVVGDSIGWGAWMGGAMVVGAALGGVGFLPVVAGLAAGNLLNDLSDHTLGRWVSNFVAEHIPAGLAKSAANGVVKYITNPLDKFLVNPIKHHLGIFLATGGAAAIFTGLRTGAGKDALKGAGAMGLSMPGQMIADGLLNKIAPFTPVKGVDLTPGKGQKFDPTSGQIVKG